MQVEPTLEAFGDVLVLDAGHLFGASLGGLRSRLGDVRRLGGSLVDLSVAGDAILMVTVRISCIIELGGRVGCALYARSVLGYIN